MEKEIKPAGDQPIESQLHDKPNKVTIVRENDTPTVKPPRIKIVGQRKIILIVIALILIIGLISFVLYKLNFSKSENDEKEILTNAISINCNLSGQSSDNNFISGDDTFSEVSKGDDVENKYIARLLNKNPAVVEILDYQTWPDYSTSDTLVTQTISKSDKNTFESLNFRDIFETEQYSYYVAGIELGIESGFYKIKKLDENPTYYHQDISTFPLLNRSGRLIRYKSLGDSNELVIFRNGKLYYRDAKGTLITDKQLSQKEIDELLKIFANSNYDYLENIYNFDEPSIMLVCNRFQNVPVGGNESDLKPITDYLENLIASIETNLNISISYRSKEDIQIKEWPINEVSISNIKALHDEALAYYRKNGSIQTDNLVYTPLPKEFINELPSGQGFTNQRIPILYYRESGRTYYVSSGTNKCIGDPCKENTFYILNVEEITVPEDKFEAVNLWPQNIGIDLSINQTQAVDPVIYLENKHFLDSVGNFGVNNNFIDDKFLYRIVGISKTEASTEIVDSTHGVYLLKVYSKHPFVDSRSDHPLSIYLKSLRDDLTYSDLKLYYPDLTQKLVNSEQRYFFIEDGNYYMIYSDNNDKEDDWVNVLPISKTTSGFNGYSFWVDDSVKLADIPENGSRISSQTVYKNQLMLQFRTDRYFIEDNYVYILDLSNEPEN